MRFRPSLRAAAVVTLVTLAAACGRGGSEETTEAGPGPLPDGATLPADHPPIGTAPQATAVPADAPEGTVRETIESGGYTYALLEMEGEEIWSAGPVTALEEGTRVALVGAMGMENFEAASLGRTFDRILFVSRFVPR